MKYYKLTDKTSEITNLRENGNPKGESCGLKTLDDLFTLKKGYPLYVAGAPYSGKTEFVLEILLNTSMLYGWKHFIYTGEAGDVENIFTELICKYVQRPLYKNSFNAMTESEKTQAEMFINEHFVVANHDKEFTIAEFYNLVKEAERELFIKFDTTLFDPFNDIKDELELFNGREDKYLAHALKEVRKQSKQNNRIDILITHIADVKAVTDKEGVRYMPPALPNEWAGGRTWWRRAFTMLLIYRPNPNCKNEHGENYEKNETHIYVQKAKPKGVGSIGMGKVYFNWKTNRYYEKTTQGELLDSPFKSSPF